MTNDNPAPHDPSGLDCEVALKRVHDFALGTLPPLETRELRQHILVCPKCRIEYRSAIETTAALAHVSQEEREAEEIERAKRRLHAERFGPPPEVVKHRRFYRLRIALIPAFFIILMLKVTGLGEPPARVDIVMTDGTVNLEKQEVVITDDPLLVLPGRWVRTREFSSAKLASREVRVEMGSRTMVLLESARPVRFRLRRGQLDIEGDVTLYSTLGMLKVTAGKGRVTLDDSGFLLEAESGDWKILDKAGEHTIPLGSPHLIEVPVLASN